MKAEQNYRITLTGSKRALIVFLIVLVFNLIVTGAMLAYIASALGAVIKKYTLEFIVVDLLLSGLLINYLLDQKFIQSESHNDSDDEMLPLNS